MANRPHRKTNKDMRADNRRATPRAEVRMPVMIYLHGLEWKAGLINLSGGGALVESVVPMNPGEQFGMGMYLDHEMQNLTDTDFLHFDLEIVDAVLQASGGMRKWRYRCKNLTSEGSQQFRRASQIVYKQLAA